MRASIKRSRYRSDGGSTEILVIGLLATLIVVLALPYISAVGEATEANFGELLTSMDDDSITLDSGGEAEGGGLR